MQLPFRYLLLPCAPLLFLWGHCTGLCRVASVNDAFIMRTYQNIDTVLPWLYGLIWPAKRPKNVRFATPKQHGTAGQIVPSKGS